MGTTTMSGCATGGVLGLRGELLADFYIVQIHYRWHVLFSWSESSCFGMCWVCCLFRCNRLLLKEINLLTIVHLHVKFVTY